MASVSLATLSWLAATPGLSWAAQCVPKPLALGAELPPLGAELLAGGPELGGLVSGQP